MTPQLYFRIILCLISLLLQLQHVTKNVDACTRCVLIFSLTIEIMYQNKKSYIFEGQVTKTLKSLRH